MTKTSLAVGLLLAAVIVAGCDNRPNEASPERLAAGGTGSNIPAPQNPLAAQPLKNEGTLAGSKRCQECHADFYKLWSTSWHGLAMQPYSAQFADSHLVTARHDVTIGNCRYRAEIKPKTGWIREIGPSGDHKYPIAHVMGGKNVYYFLTPLGRGRLQVLPLAYDVHKKAWYDMAASGVRHFPDRRDEALHWTDRMFAFNTTCFNCHVTELSTNYDLASDTYHTTWFEPGISCESCHGSGKEHARAMETGAEGHTSKDIKIIRTKEFTPAQMNDMCATCHAKLIPLSLTFRPGDKFFDHFDLVTLEHADYYPDGRDLGENYTYTSWLMSPCAKSGKLDCNHCHTPSGRLRFEGENVNQMCMPCHAQHVTRPIEHGHHLAGSKGNHCVACHMPMTRFAAMGRSDHSMRSPTPAATIAFSSPNACNLCHADHDAAWADRWVRQWYQRDYQAETLRQAELIAAARKRQWDRLPEILAELGRKEGDEIHKASLVRLLSGCEDEQKWPALIALLHDRSPLVRSSAVSALAGHLTPTVVEALLAATGDPSRLVRIRCAMALAPLRSGSLGGERAEANLERANREFMLASRARPDDWASHANLGNYYMESRDFRAAAASFQTATKLEPRQIGPLVNASMAFSNLGQNEAAEKSLRMALRLDPKNAPANYNLGLLLAELGRLDEAEQSLRTALKTEPTMAAAAFNLGVLLAAKDPAEAVHWCQKAHALRPADPKYAFTLAFYQRQNGNADVAVDLLRQVIRGEPRYWDAYLLLGEIFEGRRDFSAAAKLYRDALRQNQVPSPLLEQFEAKLREIDHHTIKAK